MFNRYRNGIWQFKRLYRKRIKQESRFCDINTRTFRSLKAIHTPGHTLGMTMILIKEERTILFGDGCGVGVLLLFPYSSSVEEYHETLTNLKKSEDKYDKIIRNHGTCESEKNLLDNVIECCELILERKDDKVDTYDALPSNINGKKIYYAKAIDSKTHDRLDGKFGNIAYSEGFLDFM